MSLQTSHTLGKYVEDHRGPRTFVEKCNFRTGSNWCVKDSSSESEYPSNLWVNYVGCQIVCWLVQVPADKRVLSSSLLYSNSPTVISFMAEPVSDYSAMRHPAIFSVSRAKNQDPAHSGMVALSVVPFFGNLAWWRGAPNASLPENFQCSWWTCCWCFLKVLMVLWSPFRLVIVSRKMPWMPLAINSSTTNPSTLYLPGFWWVLSIVRRS